MLSREYQQAQTLKGGERELLPDSPCGVVSRGMDWRRWTLTP